MTQRVYIVAALAVAALWLGGCGGPCSGVPGSCAAFVAGKSTEAEISEAFVRAKDGATLAFGEGTFKFTNTLSLATAKNLTIQGAGAGKTTLDFKGQLSGSDSLFAQDNTDNVTFRDFSVRDSGGNGIRVLGSRGVYFRRLAVSWTDPNASTHGRYGLYPVASTDVVVEGCNVSGSSDAGVYVGQSTNIVVKNNLVTRNVAGIEIENSVSADVHDNTTEDNTAGILVFDLPGPPKKGGNHVRVFNNTIRNNNTANFGAEGGIVKIAPAGTGLLLMANHDVEVFANTFSGNNTNAAAIISFVMTGEDFSGHPDYYPFPVKVNVHDNTFTGNGTHADQTDPKHLGLLLLSAADRYPGGTIPEVLYDGLVDPSAAGPANNPMQVCLKGNGAAHLFNLHLAQLNAEGSNLRDIVTIDDAALACALDPLPAITIEGE